LIWFTFQYSLLIKNQGKRNFETPKNQTEWEICPISRVRHSANSGLRMTLSERRYTSGHSCQFRVAVPRHNVERGWRTQKRTIYSTQEQAHTYTVLSCVRHPLYTLWRAVCVSIDIRLWAIAHKMT